MKTTAGQIKLFNSLLSFKTLKFLIKEKINSLDSLSLARFLTELLNESEIEELNNKIFNQEIK